MRVDLDDEFVSKLKALASKNHPAFSEEDFNAYDYSGGNYDDAFSLGASMGEIDTAIWVAIELGIDLDD